MLRHAVLLLLLQSRRSDCASSEGHPKHNGNRTHSKHEAQMAVLCSPGCHADWIADGVCDDVCFTVECAWDHADCDGHKELPSRNGTLLAHAEPAATPRLAIDANCADGCQLHWRGDGACDEPCNTAACGWDGHDCRVSDTLVVVDGSAGRGKGSGGGGGGGGGGSGGAGGVGGSGDEVSECERVCGYTWVELRDGNCETPRCWCGEGDEAPAEGQGCEVAANATEICQGERDVCIDTAVKADRLLVGIWVSIAGTAVFVAALLAHVYRVTNPNPNHPHSRSWPKGYEGLPTRTPMVIPAGLGLEPA